MFVQVYPATPVPLSGDFRRDFPFFYDLVAKNEANISTLYQLDAFDWTILILYFTILTVLAIYGVYRIKQVFEFWRYRSLPPVPAGHFTDEELPRITVQLPLFNEMYVVNRLVKARSEEHTSELQSLAYLVCRLLLEKKKKKK